MDYPKQVCVGDKIYKIPFAKDVPYDEAQLRKLEEDIKAAKEVLVEVILWEEQSTATTGTVIDGAHRVIIASKLGLTSVPTKYRSYDSVDAARFACLSINLNRRQMTQSQMTQVRKERVKIMAKLRSEGISIRRIANSLNVSPTQVKRDLNDAPKIGIQFEQPTKVTGRDGRKHPSSRTKSGAGAVEDGQKVSDDLAKVKESEPISLVDSRGNHYPFVREPQQEQDVLALFSMALAFKLLPYKILRISSSHRYDCFLQHQRKQLITEFKYLGESILKDLTNAKACYGHLHLLVCWKLDPSKLEKDFEVRCVEDQGPELPGATHVLSFSNGRIHESPITVICLSDLLEEE